MRNKNTSNLKRIFTILLTGCLFSITFAKTTQKGREILEQLRDDGWTDEEIRIAISDLGYSADEYLGPQTTKTTVIKSTNINPDTNSKTSTTKLGNEIIKHFKEDGRTDEEIKQAIEDLGYDSSSYFPSYNYTASYNNSGSIYISRSCKPYTIAYIQSINAYSSPDLKKNEYFVNIDYFKRYVDSKNAQNAECYIGGGRISSPYTDINSNERYTAPNGKIYFINGQNGSYSSNEMNNPKTFSTLEELKNYIKIHNPLTSMGVSNFQYSNNTVQNIQPIVVENQNNLNNLKQTNENTNKDTNKNGNNDEVISNLWNQIFN